MVSIPIMSASQVTSKEPSSKGAEVANVPSFSHLMRRKQKIGARSSCCHQHVVLRDIPVYEGWVDDKSASFGHNVDEFSSR